jgi:hypothetical protein
VRRGWEPEDPTRLPSPGSSPMPAGLCYPEERERKGLNHLPAYGGQPMRGTCLSNFPRPQLGRQDLSPLLNQLTTGPSKPFSEFLFPHLWKETHRTSPEGDSESLRRGCPTQGEGVVLSTHPTPSSHDFWGILFLMASLLPNSHDLHPHNPSETLGSQHRARDSVCDWHLKMQRSKCPVSPHSLLFLGGLVDKNA